MEFIKLKSRKTWSVGGSLGGPLIGLIECVSAGNFAMSFAAVGVARELI